jgi:hypothetical protein
MQRLKRSQKQVSGMDCLVHPTFILSPRPKFTIHLHSLHNSFILGCYTERITAKHSFEKEFTCLEKYWLAFSWSASSAPL